MNGLVLSGGGAKGAYQVGVIQALNEMGYDYNCITGTSVGAINGAFVVAGRFDELCTLWTELKLSDVIAGDAKLMEKLVNFDLKTKDFHQLIRSFKSIVDGSGLDISPFKQLMAKHIDESAVRSSTMDFGIVTVSLTDFKPLELFKEDIPKGQLLDYLVASANLPVFKMDRLDGRFFIDGGFYDNLPINLMAKKSIEEVVAVDLGAIGITRKVEDPNIRIRSISPSADVGLLLELTPAKSKRNMKMGYLDTLKAFERVEGRHYYFQKGVPKEAIQQWLWQKESVALPEQDYFQLKDMHPKRALFEKILPFYADMLKMDNRSDYGEICLGLLEAVAEQYKLDRLKLYDVSDLAHKIEEKYLEKVQKATPGSKLPMVFTSTLMTKQQRQILLDTAWNMVKGVFLDGAI